MRNRLALLLSLLAFALSGCDVIDASLNSERIRGSGKVVQDNRAVSGFDQVRLRGVGELSIQQTGRESLTIEGEDNLLPRIQTDVQGGVLTIGVERGVSISPTVTLRYTLTVKDISALELSGSGDILTGALRSRNFELHLPGSGHIRLGDLTADSLVAGISGSGRIEVRGQVASQRIRISGSGDYEGGNLQSQSAEVSVSGSGDSKVWARDDLSAHISGSGTVEYYGNPRVDKHVSGSGSVRNLGDRP